MVDQAMSMFRNLRCTIIWLVDCLCSELGIDLDLRRMALRDLVKEVAFVVL